MTARRLGGRRKIRRLGAAATSAALLAAACAGSSSSPKSTLSAYLSAWGTEQWATMAKLADRPPADFVAVNRSAWSDLGVRSARFSRGPVVQRGSSASAELSTDLTLAGFGALTLHSTVRMADVSGRWVVQWGPSTIADQLGPGDLFSVSRDWPARAEVLGAGGAALTPTGTFVEIGLVGQRFGANTAPLSQGLAGAGFDPTAVAAAIAQAQKRPAQFTPLETVPQARYLQLKPKIYPLAGTAFLTVQKQSALTPDLSAHLVGHTGSITAEQLKQLGSPYGASSEVGQNGIEQIYEKQLAGTPTTAVEVLDPAGRVVTTLASKAGTPGQPVQTTIDPKAQAAAESALNA